MKENGTDCDGVPGWIQVENAKRDQGKARYGSLFQEVAAILFDVDPIGINFEDNTDEYETEAGTILPRLETCQTVVSVRHVVHQEFVRWFDLKNAGEEVHYQRAAERIWEAWCRYKGWK
jgi:hypothetical protein